MIKRRPSIERGTFDHGWLLAKHSFSFGDYFDPQYMGWSVLRVINEDRVQGGEGFPTHGHRDMEILTYIISGELEHQDTMGNREKIRSGELQRMSAGKGVRHSEFNSLPHQECHLLQIWVLPEKNGIDPGYEQKSFTTELGRKDLVLVASREGAEGSISLNQDIKLYLSKQRKQEELLLPLHSQRKGWIQLVSGEVTISSGKTPDGAVRLSAGDGCAISEEGALRALCSHDAEFLFFDLP